MSTAIPILEIPYEQIELDPGFNCRYFYGELVELKNSIMNSGLEMPLVLRQADDGVKYYLVGGHRRYSAIKMGYEENNKDFDFTKIPCQVRKNYTLQDRTLDLIRHNSGLPLQPLEEAETYQRLVVDCKLDSYAIAKLTGHKRSKIMSYLSLAEADEKIKNLVKENVVTAATAINIIKMFPYDIEAQLQEISGAMDRAIETGSSRVTSGHVDKLSEKKPLPRFKMLAHKVSVEHLAAKKINPNVVATMKIIEEVLFEGLPVQKAFDKINNIN